MPSWIENKKAYFSGAKIGDLYGNNYIEVSNAGVLSFHGTAHIDDESTTDDTFLSIKIGDVTGGNYIEVDSNGILYTRGTSKISDDSVTVDIFKSINITGGAASGIDFTGTEIKGINFNAATLTQGLTNGFITMGIRGTPIDIAMTDETYFMHSAMKITANPGTTKDAVAGLFKVMTDGTNDVGNAQFCAVRGRVIVDKDVDSCYTSQQHLTVSGTTSVGNEACAGSFYLDIIGTITGDAADTRICALQALISGASPAGVTGDFNVANFWLSANVNADAVQRLYCYSSSTADNMLNIENDGTVTNGILINNDGTMTTGILVEGAITTGVSITATSLTDGINISGATPTNGITISSVCGTYGLDINGAGATGINIAAQTTMGIALAVAAGVGGIAIDAGAVNHAADGAIVDIDLDIEGQYSVNAINVNMDFDTTGMDATDTCAALRADINELLVHTNNAIIYGADITITGFDGGRCDIIGYNILIDGDKTGGDANAGFVCTGTATINDSGEILAGLKVDFSGLTLTDGNVYGSYIDMTFTNGSTAYGLFIVNGADTTNAIGIDADTTDVTADGSVISVDLGVETAAVNAFYATIDVAVALGAADIVKGVYLDMNPFALDADTSGMIGYDVLMTGISTSQADLTGYKIAFDGTMDTADTITGVIIDGSSLTIDDTALTLHGIEIAFAGVTDTDYATGEFNGLDITMPAAYQAADVASAIKITGGGAQVDILSGITATMYAMDLALAAATVGINIDATTAKHTGSDIVILTLDVNTASCNGMSMDIDVDTALTTGNIVNGISIDIDGDSGDHGTSYMRGLFLTSANTSTGVNTAIDIDGTWDTGLDLAGATATTSISLGTDGRIAGLIDLVTMGLGGDVAIDIFPFNTVTLTEASAAYAKAEDGGVFLNLSATSGGGGYTNDYAIFPDTELEDDACNFGADAPFGAIYVDMSATVGVYGADSVIWEYWSGAAWSTLTIIWDYTDTTANDGQRPFQQDGYIIWSAPTNWATTTIDGQLAYWVRARVKAGFNITTIPETNSKEHQIPSDANAFELPYAGTISRCRFQWDIVSTGTADTKVIFYNFTTGAASGIQTITKALADLAIADLAMTVAKDDEIGIYVSQVDGGGTEYGDGHLEMKVTRT